MPNSLQARTLPNDIFPLRKIPNFEPAAYLEALKVSSGVLDAKGGLRKGSREGSGIPLESFNVSLTPGKPEVLESPDAFRWMLLSFEAAPGYVGAVVGEGHDWRPAFWDWTP